MSRTTLSVITATSLVIASLAIMIGRYQVLGDEVKVPNGRGSWRVVMLVRGQCATADAKLLTLTPLDFSRQHIRDEVFRSDALLAKPPDAKHPSRRQVLWAQRSGATPGSFQV